MLYPVLQSRWRLEGRDLIYYGLRQPPDLLRRRIPLDRRTAALIAALDGKRSVQDISLTHLAAKLIRRGVLVDRTQVRPSPASLEEARFCTGCAANDYIIPGLELDGNGLCPICATKGGYEGLKNVIPVLTHIPPTPGAKYDAAVFYTGGKDSSYLLYYVSRVLKLRTVALCWETPFMSDWARESIAHAREALPEVDFFVEAAPEKELRAIYRKTYALQKNVCICPSVAYVLFFERMVRWGVPYLILGNEPAQCKNLIYNQMAPPLYFRPWVQNMARLGFNAGRVLRLRPPFSAGQMELYMTVKQLAFGRSPVTRLLKYKNELVEHTCASLAQAPAFLAPFRASVSRAAKTGRLPALVHIDFDDASGGVYQWNDVKQLLKAELGWVDAPMSGKGLHTSCKIERCKEWSQFSRFRAMETQVIPFSAIELSLASSSGAITRDEAIRELRDHTGFTQEPPPETDLMLEALEEGG